MFVLLQHDPPDAGQPPHWDFLIEVAGRELLPTWRLAANPLASPGPIAAERIADHRRLYLDYEGEIGGGRGRVRRLDHGECQIEVLTGDEAVVRIAGAQWRGRIMIRRAGTGLELTA